MVSKLKLNKPVKDNPNTLSVLLPYTAVDEEKGTLTILRSPKEASVVSGGTRLLSEGVVEKAASGTYGRQITRKTIEASRGLLMLLREGSTAKELDKRLAKTDGQCHIHPY